jgi:hypothetical protein
MASKNRGRAPKVEGGLPEVLFLRANRELIDRLDALVRKKNEERPYHHLSRADVARELLFSALDAEATEAKGKKR